VFRPEVTEGRIVDRGTNVLATLKNRVKKRGDSRRGIKQMGKAYIKNKQIGRIKIIPQLGDRRRE